MALGNRSSLVIALFTFAVSRLKRNYMFDSSIFIVAYSSLAERVPVSSRIAPYAFMEFSRALDEVMLRIAR
jgi:hypothetical protein